MLGDNKYTLINIDDDNQEDGEFLEILELSGQNQDNDFDDEVDDVHEVNVLVENSTTGTSSLVSMDVESNTNLPDIIQAAASVVFHNKNNSNNNYEVELLTSSYPHLKYDYNIKVKQVDYYKEQSNEILDSSQSSTKVNFLNLSDKENESDATVEETVDNIVRTPSVESILSSRSPSPALNNNEDDELTNTIQLDGSSLLPDEETKKTNKSKSYKVNVLVIYPPPPEKGGISINFNDYECLGGNEFLNDVIIDFYLSYLMREVVSPEDRQRTHIFSSHFYTRFVKPYQSNEDSNFASEDEKRHAGVQRWTKSINIFEKDFIIVPVNENHHWNLVIICFPYLVNNDSESDASYNHDCDPQKPCFLLFDSLYSKKTAAVEKLRGYLACEYFAKRGEKKSFSSHHIPLIKPKIPKQSNATDCGLFVLQYVENFFKKPIQDFSLKPLNLEKWFTEKDIDDKREKIAKLIGKLATDFHEGKNVELPNIDFPKENCVKSRKIESDSEDEEIEFSTLISKSSNHSKTVKDKIEDIEASKKKLQNNLRRLITYSDSSSDSESIPLHYQPAESLDNKKNNLSKWQKKSTSIDRKNSLFSKKTLSLSSNRTLPCYSNSSETQSVNRRVYQKSPDIEKKSFSNVKTLSLSVNKTLPCYANSSKISVLDEPPVVSKYGASSSQGTPPYYIPNTSLKTKGRSLFTNLNKTMDLGEATESPVKRNKISSIPNHLQSRGQRMVKMVQSQVSNGSDSFYHLNSSLNEFYYRRNF